MRRPRDPALKAQRAARDRLLRQAREAAARAEAAQVAEGVAETVSLARARGAAVVAVAPAGRDAPGRDAPARADPGRPRTWRRLTGLDWLAGKGRISPAARAAGERYGEAYRGAARAGAIPSSLAAPRAPGGGQGPDLQAALARGARAEAARRRLAELRRRLADQPDLVAACDQVCGEEKTPREAAGGDRDAARLEAVLKVALDLLAGA